MLNEIFDKHAGKELALGSIHRKMCRRSFAIQIFWEMHTLLNFIRRAAFPCSPFSNKVKFIFLLFSYATNRGEATSKCFIIIWKSVGRHFYAALFFSFMH